MQRMFFMNEKVLGHFLSYKRSTLKPADYNIVTTSHRRVSGLTREEVAELANVSTDWYTRIEQGRSGSTPSPEVLSSLADVLHLSPSEREYIANLVVRTTLQTSTKSDKSAIQSFLDQQSMPAFMTDSFLTVQQFNHIADQLYNFSKTKTELERNLFWRTFQLPILRNQLPDWESYAHLRSAQFRQIYSTAPESDFLFRIFTYIKDDPVFKITWDKLAVSGFPMQKILFQHTNQFELYFGETVWLSPDSSNYLFLENPLDHTTREKLNQIKIEE